KFGVFPSFTARFKPKPPPATPPAPPPAPKPRPPKPPASHAKDPDAPTGQRENPRALFRCAGRKRLLANPRRSRAQSADDTPARPVGRDSLICPEWRDITKMIIHA